MSVGKNYFSFSRSGYAGTLIGATAMAYNGLRI